jgi:signal transduction histidine kinase
MVERARRNLIVWNIGVGLSLVAVIVLAMYFSISSGIEKEITGDLTTTADLILQNPALTSSPPSSPSENSRGGDNDNQGRSQKEDNEGDNDRNTRLALSDTFYFLLDAKGTVLANSRNINYPGLPDLTGLSRAQAGESFFTDLTLANGLPLRLYTVPVRQSDGKISGILQVGKDLSTHREQLQGVVFTTGVVSGVGLALALVAALFLTRRSLIPVRQAMERQREFVADASHELRTPITLIRANAEVILRHKHQTVAQNTELLQDICQESDYLTRLVSDLLTLARADMDKLEAKLEPLELRHLAAEVTREMRPLAETKNLKLEFEDSASGLAELWINGEALRLKQLLVILLDNAIKYTPSGRVSLQLERGRNQTVIIKVSDTGIGIAPDKLERIFERFYRVDKARSRSEGGFGLGLAIASWIVHLHKGTLQVNSHLGQGTTFTVTLPTHLPSNLIQN